ncbi:hypothetical protein GCM10007971_11010 [Oceanobacillus indicireducens]|uniref:Uncharacterized protein n=1 Tax=Oceanobacillus indicireducens TaxID=1004261 RepID=A0A917XVE5_9BACI|nr:hypothetical protein GCM10007971_11010 [Oceanobacillus indicireducens]
MPNKAAYSMQWENKRELFDQSSPYPHVLGKETEFIFPIQPNALCNRKVNWSYLPNKATCSIKWENKHTLFSQSSRMFYAMGK